MASAVISSKGGVDPGAELIVAVPGHRAGGDELGIPLAAAFRLSAGHVPLSVVLRGRTVRMRIMLRAETRAGRLGHLDRGRHHKVRRRQARLEGAAQDRDPVGRAWAAER